ncbi:MAG: RsmE family RNA methyltransferase [Candidatus Muiribacteriota bacterium]
MHYFFLEHKENSDGFIYSKEVLKHIKVLRIKPQEKVLVNYNNEVFSACLNSLTKTSAFFKVLSKEPFIKPKIRKILYQAFPKNKKFEFIIEKAVELGFEKIIPVKSRYCEKNLNLKKEKRYKRIILNSAMQCKSPFLPQLKEEISIKNIEPADGVNIVLYEKGKNSIKDILRKNKDKKKFNVLCGPEGGFSQDEIKGLENMGFVDVKINSNILRCETAPLYAGVVLNYEYEC